MMPTTQLPGFQNPVHDAQQTFRTLLQALAHPGQLAELPVGTVYGHKDSRSAAKILLQAPPGLMLACAAACLTLFDLETSVWLQPGFNPAVKSWLLFHTGCQFVEAADQATFAVIREPVTLPALSTFNRGMAEVPESSTTLLIQLETVDAGDPVILEGPGIQDEQHFSPQGLPDWFWAEWMANTQLYPLGVDVFLFTQTMVVGLPRTTKGRLVKST